MPEGRLCGPALRELDRVGTSIAEVHHGASKDPAGVKQDHCTQKPVELMRPPILNHTLPGQAIYDGFLGTRSSRQSGRAAYKGAGRASEELALNKGAGRSRKGQSGLSTSPRLIDKFSNQC